MKKIIIMFSGQGSQYPGMGKDLYDRYNIVKKLYSMASDILNVDLAKLSFYSDHKELIKTQNAQLTTFLLSYATYQVYLQKFESVPFAVCGHSLGEITALTVSNAISFKDALKIIQKRGLLMSDDSKVKKGKMLAVFNIPIQKLENLCNDIRNTCGYITIANYNSSSQYILSGENSAIENLKEKLKNEIVFPLKVSGAFHSELMRPIAEEFYNYLKKFQYSPLMIPIISSIDGKIYDNLDIASHLKLQLTSSVYWKKVMKTFKDLNIDKAIEIGPKEVLAKFVKEDIPKVNSAFIKQYFTG